MLAASRRPGLPTNKNRCQFWQSINLLTLNGLVAGLAGRYAVSMFVAITCPTCRHCGYIPKDRLPRQLLCSHCGRRTRFESASKLLTKEEERRFASNIAKLPRAFAPNGTRTSLMSAFGGKADMPRT